MPISVLCPSCKARFQVSEKFAGKQGPCPKCKAPITIPKLEDQVQVHAPEEFTSGGKTMTGESAVKPIARKETKLPLIPTVIAVCAALAVVAIAFVARDVFRNNSIAVGVGLLFVSIPITAGGYTFLREQELEPHRGLWLWVRAAICGICFSLLWLAFSYIPVDLRSSGWSYVLIAPVLLSAAGGIAFACYDLDFPNGFLLGCFYTALTLGLGWLAGLEMPWSVVTSR